MSDSIKNLVYKQFLQEKSIIVNSRITDETVDRVTMQIIKYNLEDDQLEDENVCPHCEAPIYNRREDSIKMYIHSPGGDAYASLAIIGAMATSKTPIDTIVLGEAMSGAFLISICGNKRLAQPYARFMWHKVGVNHIDGTLDHINDERAELNDLQSVFEEIILSKTSISKDQLTEETLRKDWSFGAKLAIDLNIIDEVLTC